jgi:Homeodomain-like domain
MDLFDQRVQAAYPTALDERPRPRRGLSSSICSQVLRYLLLGWRPEDIVDECGVSRRTVYNMQANLARYGSPAKPRYRLLGRPSKLTIADQKALLNWLLHEGWRYQDEIVLLATVRTWCSCQPVYYLTPP